MARKTALGHEFSDIIVAWETQPVTEVMGLMGHRDTLLYPLQLLIGH
jgi:hypothetical protein